MDIHSPEAQVLNEFRQHQESILPITARYFGKRNLDIGCGNGFTSIALQEKLGIELTLCDIIDMRHELAKKLPFYKIENETLPFSDKIFDSSYLQYVLHHIDSKEKVKQLLSESFRVAHTVILIEEIAGEKTDVVAAKIFDKNVNQLIHPRHEMNVYKYYSAAEVITMLKII